MSSLKFTGHILRILAHFFLKKRRNFSSTFHPSDVYYFKKKMRKREAAVTSAADDQAGVESHDCKACPGSEQCTPGSLQTKNEGTCSVNI